MKKKNEKQIQIENSGNFEIRKIPKNLFENRQF